MFLFACALLYMFSGSMASTIDEAVCGIVAATNIGSIKAYEMWNCTVGVANSDPCTWKGITCNETEVNAILLAGLYMTGTFPSQLFGLASLSSLDVNGNKLSGKILMLSY